jgi:hypothetical protein
MNPMIIDKSNVFNNTRGIFQISANNIAQTNTPMVLNITNGTFRFNRAIIDALFRVQTNSKLYVYSSTFDMNFSFQRGSIFIADYKGVYIYVKGSTFSKNKSYRGGLFYTH